MSGICVIGDVNLDIVSLLSQPLQINSDTKTSNSFSLGGSPCNMSMWLSHIGTPVDFLAAVGTDLIGDWIKQELTRGGISTNYIQEIADSNSGSCIIMVNADGQRTMLPDPAANLALKLTDKETQVISNSSVVVMSAYSFLRTETRPLALEVVEVVKNCSARLVIDAASSAPITAAGVDLVREYLANADLVLANQDEFDVLDDPVWTTGLADLVVKLGGAGAKWIRNGEVECVVPAVAVNAIDTTGAGDSFLAGLVSVLAQHQDWFAINNQDRQDALVRATGVAALNVINVGAGPKV
jgi:sugar/nucleoside kinase (ribokinase family)